MTMKVMSIVGTRPQFLKLAPLNKILEKDRGIDHIIVHTGQHFDEEMSGTIFDSLGIKKPDYFLNINNLTHIGMLSKMMLDLESVIQEEKPDFILVYGDCNTTLAGGLVANKTGSKLVHIESGLRGYNKSMPEEINRKIIDHIADIRCCPNKLTVDNLAKEDIHENNFIVGNLQIDLLKESLRLKNNKILLNNDLSPNNYILLTIHRHYNTNRETLRTIFEQCAKIGEKTFFPVHPRTQKIINNYRIPIPDNVVIHRPVHFLDMVSLQSNAKLIITDSGGIQPESHFLKKRCLTVRTETEWLDTIESGQNLLVKSNTIYKSYLELINTDIDFELDSSYFLSCSTEIVRILKNNL